MQSPSSAIDALPVCQQALTRQQAEHIIHGDPELIILLLMKLSAEVAALRAAALTPNAPPSSVPAFAKPATPAGRTGRSKRGAKLGHVGHNRASPVTIDRTEEHPLHTCPDCGTAVSAQPSRHRTRIIEDIPKDIQSEVVEHVIPGHYCSYCKKVVEGKGNKQTPANGRRSSPSRYAGSEGNTSQRKGQGTDDRSDSRGGGGQCADSTVIF